MAFCSRYFEKYLPEFPALSVIVRQAVRTRYPEHSNAADDLWVLVSLWVVS